MLRVGALPRTGLEGLRDAASILFSVFSWIALYLILRTQGTQPFNPRRLPAAGPSDVSFNTASSFVSNTNWQYYGGETTLTYSVADGAD